MVGQNVTEIGRGQVEQIAEEAHDTGLPHAVAADSSSGERAESQRMAVTSPAIPSMEARGITSEAGISGVRSRHLARLENLYGSAEATVATSTFNAELEQAESSQARGDVAAEQLFEQLVMAGKVNPQEVVAILNSLSKEEYAQAKKALEAREDFRAELREKFGQEVTTLEQLVERVFKGAKPEPLLQELCLHAPQGFDAYFTAGLLNRVSKGGRQTSDEIKQFFGLALAGLDEAQTAEVRVQFDLGAGTDSKLDKLWAKVPHRQDPFTEEQLSSSAQVLVDGLNEGKKLATAWWRDSGYFEVVLAAFGGKDRAQASRLLEICDEKLGKGPGGYMQILRENAEHSGFLLFPKVASGEGARRLDVITSLNNGFDPGFLATLLKESGYESQALLSGLTEDQYRLLRRACMENDPKFAEELIPRFNFDSFVK